MMNRKVETEVKVEAEKVSGDSLALAVTFMRAYP